MSRMKFGKMISIIDTIISLTIAMKNGTYIKLENVSVLDSGTIFMADKETNLKNFLIDSCCKSVSNVAN